MLAKPTPYASAIMPERLANLAPGQQVTEIIGSGPYRFVKEERVPGSLAVFARNADYVPRTDGPPVGTAGPKIANFERVEWHTIPDPATAAAALQSGEVDWWEQPTSDLLPLLRKDPNLTVDIIDFLGYQAVLRFNHLYPPFDNPGIRRALLGAFSQTDMMQAVAGENPTMWKDGVGFFSPELVGDVIDKVLRAENVPASELPGRRLMWTGINMVMQNLGSLLGMLAFTFFAIALLWARVRVEVAKSRLMRAEEDAIDLGLDTRTEA